MNQNPDPVLEVRNLVVSIPAQKGVLKPVNDVSLCIPEGKIVGIVGESGCGKSMTARAIMGLTKSPVKTESGCILLDGRELIGLPESELCGIRGSEISMIFQEPMTSLNPVMKVGRQVDEAIRVHMSVPASEARAKTIEMFESVGIPEPEARYNCYPHELSGGLRQRVMIAMAMICRPRLLIADEPTTALDVTVEAQILHLMRELNKSGTSILLISHNLGVIAKVCDYVYVMYAGRILEEAWKSGCKFDAWTEHFNPDIWNRAFNACAEELGFAGGGDLESFYNYRKRAEEEILPWDMINSFIDRDYLLSEKHKAENAMTTDDCRLGCNLCGVNHYTECFVNAKAGCSE